MAVVGRSSSSVACRSGLPVSHRFGLVRRENKQRHIESLVAYCRRNFMVPVPKLDDFNAINEGLTNA